MKRMTGLLIGTALACALLVPAMAATVGISTKSEVKARKSEIKVLAEDRKEKAALLKSLTEEAREGAGIIPLTEEQKKEAQAVREEVQPVREELKALKDQKNAALEAGDTETVQALELQIAENRTDLEAILEKSGAILAQAKDRVSSCLLAAVPEEKPGKKRRAVMLLRLLPGSHLCK